MRPRHHLGLALSGCLLLAGVALADPLPVPNDLPAMEGVATAAPAKVRTEGFAVYDSRGRVKRTQQWRITDAGGNCCEVYSHTTATGRIYEIGGTYLHYSDDRGKTWKVIKYAVPPEYPLTNGEGAATVAPNGDIVGITWDPYSADVLLSYKFTLATKKFEYALQPLHGPFFDRPWISVARGPITAFGKTGPYATIVRGAYPSKDVLYMSTDGLHYDLVTSPALDAAQGGEAGGGAFVVPVVKDPGADWTQDVPDAGGVYLNGGGALHVEQAGDVASPCQVARLSREDASWSCVTPASPWKGTVRQDSRGWLTRGIDDQGGVRLETSTDGGRTWRGLAVSSPVGGRSEGMYDVKVNGKLGRAVVLVRYDQPNGKGQDVAFLFDVRSGTPRHLETLLIGRGDAVTAAGAQNTGDRFDYMTVGFLPDGKLVASFHDKSLNNPQLAIQL